MKNTTLVVIGAIVLVLAIWLVARDRSSPDTTPTSTSSSTPSQVLLTPGPDEARYTDSGGRFTLIYPKAFSISGPKSALTTSWRQDAASTGYLLATLTIPKSYMPRTNFSEAVLTIGQSNDKTELGSSGCPTKLAGYIPGSAAAVVINGQTFTKITRSDAGAGNLYQTTGYYTIRDGDCYAVEYTIHSTNIGNYDPSQGITPFDNDKIVGVLEKIVKSFTFAITSN